MTVWFSDPKQLFDVHKRMELWPGAHQNPADRINATSRFIILASMVLFLVKRDIRLLYLGFMVILALWCMHKFKMVSGMDKTPASSVPPSRKKVRFTDAGGTEHDIVDLDITAPDPVCTEPTFDNPMGNVLLSDYTADPQRPPACWSPSVHDEIDETLTNTFMAGNTRSRAPLPSVQKRAAARQFTSTPVSSIPGDQTAFAEWLYGKKNAPHFKDGSSPYGDPNFRGVQLEAFSGLDGDGNLRRTATRGGNN